MKKYRIHMNGKIYEMEIELVDDSEPIEPPKRVVPNIMYDNDNSSNSIVQVIDPSANKEVVRNHNKITSLMPGTVIKINYTIGNYVEKGKTVMILEAMKMENEILASKSGIIKELFVKEGQTVPANFVLFEME